MTPEELEKILFREVHVKKDGMAPCPFCGSGDVRAELSPPTAWTAICVACGSYGPHTENGGALVAIDAWSRRSATPRDWLHGSKRGIPLAASVGGWSLEGLSPCPFCGHADLVYEEDGSTINAVSCRVCDASGAVGDGSREKAYEAWNRRSG